MAWRGEPLPADLAHEMEEYPATGHTKLRCTSVLDVVLKMMEPILDLMERAMEDAPRQVTRHDLFMYIMFRVGLGLLRPQVTDHVWDPDELHYSPTLARMCSRVEYYYIQQWAKPDVALLMEVCSEHWSDIWQCGAVVAGDETLVPHKGQYAKDIRQHIPRKPKPTGIKLFALADAVTRYVFDLYLYSGKLELDIESDFAGNMGTGSIVYRWHSRVPAGTMIVGDSAFGTHKVARDLAAVGRPFLFLTKRNAKMVSETAAGCEVGGLQTISSRKLGYQIHTYKNPGVGAKPPRVVPMLTNCHFKGGHARHRRGYRLHRIVSAYRTWANSVDVTNQLALQHRHNGRYRTWSQAVRSFVWHTAMTNSYAVCRQLDLPTGSCMREFQWRFIKELSPDVPRPIPVHCPVVTEVRRECAHCKQGRVKIQCKLCQKSYHIECFGPAHGVL
jgi:hypothetical protein